MSALEEVYRRFTLGDVMRRFMVDAGYSGQQMADYEGVSRFTVSSWLNDHTEPGTAALRVWAERTGVPYEALCAIRDSNPEPADYELRLRLVA